MHEDQMPVRHLQCEGSELQYKIQIQRKLNENENKNATGEATYAGALRAPRAGSLACVFVFVFVSIYV